MRHDLVLGSARELGTVGLVAGLSGCYAGVLVTTSSFLPANGEHAAAAKERDLALDHSEKARIDEVGLRPDGIVSHERTTSEAAWHFMG